MDPFKLVLRKSEIQFSSHFLRTPAIFATFEKFYYQYIHHILFSSLDILSKPVMGTISRC